GPAAAPPRLHPRANRPAAVDPATDPDPHRSAGRAPRRRAAEWDAHPPRTPATARADAAGSRSQSREILPPRSAATPRAPIPAPLDAETSAARRQIEPRDPARMQVVERTLEPTRFTVTPPIRPGPAVMTIAPAAATGR